MLWTPTSITHSKAEDGSQMEREFNSERCFGLGPLIALHTVPEASLINGQYVRGSQQGSTIAC